MRRAIAHGDVVSVDVVDLPVLGGTSADATSLESTCTRTVRTHWQRSHWNSVRVATRDADENIVGDRLGAEGVACHYEGPSIHPAVGPRPHQPRRRHRMHSPRPAIHRNSLRAKHPDGVDGPAAKLRVISVVAR